VGELEVQTHTHTDLLHLVNLIPEELQVLATRLATYVSSDSTTAKVTSQ